MDNGQKPAVGIDGVVFWTLQPNLDHRGSLTEVFREGWAEAFSPVQWNLLQSRKNVLRGTQVHLQRTDHIILVSGCVHIGFCDLRADSPTRGKAGYFLAQDPAPVSITIPPGVAHGFYFLKPSGYMEAMSKTWDPLDEIHIRWNDPEMGIPWPAGIRPILSDEDKHSASLREIAHLFDTKRKTG